MESSAGIADRSGAALRGGDRALRRPAPQRRPEPSAVSSPGLLAHARDYLALTKPRIISLLLWTTVMTMFWGVRGLSQAVYISV